MKESKFSLGEVAWTRGIAIKAEEDLEFRNFISSSLKRHRAGDWGEIDKEDWKENEFSLDKYLRLFSAYKNSQHPKIWIITEADRSVTTILFPNEY